MKNEIIKVLLIDDEEGDYILTCELFSLVKTGNYLIEWASSYEAGLKIAARGDHQVCLVDYRLGARSGVQLIREARESRITTPMILLTGQGDHKVDVEAMEAGATDYLVKDETSPMRLERTVRYAVRLNAERCQVEAELETYAQKQVVIAKISRLALTVGELADLFAEAVSLVAKTLGVDYSMVWELAPNDAALVLRAAAGLPETCVVGQVTMGAGEESQAGFTLLSNEPVVVADLRTENRFSPSPVLLDHGVVSGMTVVIRGVGDQSYGVLGAYSTAARNFATDDVNFLRAVANVLAAAVARKRAEDSIRQARDFSENLIKTGNVIILSLDAEGNLGIFNQAAEKITGYAAAELRDANWFERLVPPERFPWVRAEFNRLMELGIRGAFEGPIITRSGEERYIVWQSNQVRAEGEIVATILFGNDVTDRRRAEAELLFKTSLLESQTEASIDGILVVANDARILSFNSRFAELWHVSPKTLAAQSVESAYQSVLDSVAKPEAFLERVDYLFKHPEEESDDEIQLKDGRAFEGHSAPVKSEKGEFFGRVWFFHDITARQAAEQALRQSESYARALFENTPDAVLIANDQGIYVDANPAACALLGISYDEIIGRTLNDFAEPDYRGDPAEAWAKFLKAGRMQGFVRLRRPDGEIVDVDLSGTANFLPGRHFSMLRDVTERRKLEQQLRQSQKLESVGMLAGGIAHDFNNLLTVITGYSELALRQLKETDPVARSVEEIKKASDKAAALTRQLLAFSRKQVLQPKILDLNSVITDIRKMLVRLVSEDIELRTVPAADLSQVKADPGQIEQVILNLVVNAKDAMPKGGKITIETNNVYLDEDYARHHIAVQPGSYVMLAVSDTGHGMSAETQKHIFEPFFTTKEQGRGTGLGLSTVYGIVKQSGGNIWAYSEVGLGTCFKVYLPLVHEEVTAPEPEVIHPESASGTETILVAEDEEMVRTLVRDSLRPRGYTVLEAASGREALSICEKHGGPIHLLLTDVVMPRMSGRELAEQLVTMRPDTRVLYMSGYTDQAIVHHGVLDGDIAFIGKPFTPDALVHKVVEVLQQSDTR